jgi:hypothetical protein
VEKKHERKIMNRCFVSFSIGKRYSDQVWCDVILMNACSFLLIHPLKYDRNVQHNGFKNTFSFMKDGVKIILGSSKHRITSKPSK